MGSGIVLESYTGADFLNPSGRNALSLTTYHRAYLLSNIVSLMVASKLSERYRLLHCATETARLQVVQNTESAYCFVAYSKISLILYTSYSTLTLNSLLRRIIPVIISHLRICDVLEVSQLRQV